MGRLNPCVTGDTKVLTVNGLKSFDELAASGDDVSVYCLANGGGVFISKMIHPRLTGYNVEIVKITLADGTVLKASHYHEFLTKDGYVAAEDVMEGDKFRYITSIACPDDLEPYGEYRGTKKGTVIKTCEVCGEEFETVWDERELCAKPGCEYDLYRKVEGIKADIAESQEDVPDENFIPVKSVEFLDKRENVYNGTVAMYHNYFTEDETTGTIVNQMNCGE